MALFTCDVPPLRLSPTISVLKRIFGPHLGVPYSCASLEGSLQLCLKFKAKLKQILSPTRLGELLPFMAVPCLFSSTYVACSFHATHQEGDDYAKYFTKL